MPDLTAIIQSGTANAWFYLPVAVVLGALHALEPGHSKSLMAAFIVAVRGTPAQAVLLGISAALGHTIVVWTLAILGLTFGSRMNFERVEPWLLLVSGVIVVALAVRLLVSLKRVHADAHDGHGHGHEHSHSNSHNQDDHRHDHSASRHTDDEDAHAATHRREIEDRFKNRAGVTAGEIAWFGFTGGLLPCPAAIAVLLICLQVKALSLGIAMVMAFSLGLAVTLVSVGLAAAWGTQKAAQRWSGFDAWSARLPYVSAAIVLVLGIAMGLRGLAELGLFGLA